MLLTKYKLKLLYNLQCQNKVLLKQNNLVIKEILSNVKSIKETIDECYEKINTNNILLICIFILQIFILFK
jgi:hypothetical protein